MSCLYFENMLLEPNSKKRKGKPKLSKGSHRLLNPLCQPMKGETVPATSFPPSPHLHSISISNCTVHSISISTSTVSASATAPAHYQYQHQHLHSITISISTCTLPISASAPAQWNRFNDDHLVHHSIHVLHLLWRRSLFWSCHSIAILSRV